jgi:enamine deaminase RidA (YjgF/YER057c/UK114 family)
VPELQFHQAPSSMAPGTGYSHAVTGQGRLVAISGQVALDAAGNPVGPGDTLAQARQAFANVGHALAAAGASFTDVVKLTFFLTDIADLPAARTARDEHIDAARPPASTAVQVQALFRPEFLIEIEAWALCAP